MEDGYKNRNSASGSMPAEILAGNKKPNTSEEQEKRFHWKEINTVKV